MVYLIDKMLSIPLKLFIIVIINTVHMFNMWVSVHGLYSEVREQLYGFSSQFSLLHRLLGTPGSMLEHLPLASLARTFLLR